MPLRATVDLGAGVETVPCPWLTEEDPSEFLNTTYVNPFHFSTDRVGAWHARKANAGIADGAVVSFTSKRRIGGVWKNPKSSEWRANTPSGRNISLYSSALGAPGSFGWWNKQ